MGSSSNASSATKTHEPRKHTADVQVSLCIPSSVISETNASNLEHITHIAYQVAKAATIYIVSEVVILEIPSNEAAKETPQSSRASHVDSRDGGGNKKIIFDSVSEDKEQNAPQQKLDLPETCNNANNALLFASLVQYFVTPKYLVKSVFEKSPCNKKFKYAEKLPKLSTLPFMNNKGVSGRYKEGFTLSKHAPRVKKKARKSSATKKLKVTKYVNIGDSKPFELSGSEVPANVRVTVDLKSRRVVSPELAYGISGCEASFGYHVRLAKTVSSVFTELSFAQGYTESIFVNADNYFSETSTTHLPRRENSAPGQVLLVVGNLCDLQLAFERETIEGLDKVVDMFDYEMPIPAGLRIEDAALVGLAMVQSALAKT